MADKKKVLITVLIAIIVVMAAILVYMFLIRPAFTGFVTQKQTEGYNYCLGVVTQNIIAQLQQNRFVQFPIGNETLYLRPFNPQQPQ
jgi:flagellar basal body-associated protein FliL